MGDPAERTWLSKAISRALRHDPGRYGLMLDGEGWVPLDELVAAFRRDPRWRGLTAADVEDLVRDSPEQRHEITDGRIRARYGHSLPRRVDRPAAAPPGRLYHGTAAAAVPAIMAAGLKPMRRQYVHLSADREAAVEVGGRRGGPVTVLVVDAAAAQAAGVVFRRGNDRTWLAEHVPPAYLRVEPERAPRHERRP